MSKTFFSYFVLSDGFWVEEGASPKLPFLHVFFFLWRRAIPQSRGLLLASFFLPLGGMKGGTRDFIVVQIRRTWQAEAGWRRTRRGGGG